MVHKGLSWRDRVFVAALCVVGFLALIYIAFGSQKIGAFLSSSVTVAWVQALGTLLALAVAVGIAWWEGHQRRIEANLRAAQLVHGRVFLLKYLQQKLDLLNTLHQDQNAKNFGQLARQYDGLRFYCREVQLIEIAEMPNLECMRLFTVVKQFTAETMELIEPGGYTDWLSQDDVRRFRHTSSNIGQIIRRLSDQAARIGE